MLGIDFLGFHKYPHEFFFTQKSLPSALLHRHGSSEPGQQQHDFL